MRRICSYGSVSMRRPSRRISPPAMRPGGSSRPMIAMPVSDFPAPDSPTTPSPSPGASENEMPSTAVSVPRRVGNSTRRSFTSSSGSLIGTAGQLRGQWGRQPVADQVYRKHEHDERDAREYRDPPFARHHEIVADADQRAERRLGRRHAHA